MSFRFDSIFSVKGLVILISFFHFNLKGQDVFIGIQETSILYRGYENRVCLSTTTGQSDFIVTTKNAHISRDTNDNRYTYYDGCKHRYIVQPGAGRNATFYFIDTLKQDTIDILTLPVKNFPRPILLLGGLEPNNHYKKEHFRIQSRLFCRLPIELYLMEGFGIQSWSLYYNDSLITNGTGSSLNIQAQDFLQNIQPNSEIKFVATVYGANNIKRRVQSILYVKED